MTFDDVGEITIIKRNSYFLEADKVFQRSRYSF